jgi:hypothetical protein
LTPITSLVLGLVKLGLDFSYHYTPSFKLRGFHARLFRRSASDETILLRMKPFSAFGADIPKRSLTINLPNETPPSGDQ